MRFRQEWTEKVKELSPEQRVNDLDRLLSGENLERLATALTTEPQEKQDLLFLMEDKAEDLLYFREQYEAYQNQDEEADEDASKMWKREMLPEIQKALQHGKLEEYLIEEVRDLWYLEPVEELRETLEQVKKEMAEKLQELMEDSTNQIEWLQKDLAICEEFRQHGVNEVLMKYRTSYQKLEEGWAIRQPITSQQEAEMLMALEEELFQKKEQLKAVENLVRYWRVENLPKDEEAKRVTQMMDSIKEEQKQVEIEMNNPGQMLCDWYNGDREMRLAELMDGWLKGETSWSQIEELYTGYYHQLIRIPNPFDADPRFWKRMVEKTRYGWSIGHYLDYRMEAIEDDERLMNLLYKGEVREFLLGRTRNWMSETAELRDQIMQETANELKWKPNYLEEQMLYLQRTNQEFFEELTAEAETEEEKQNSLKFWMEEFQREAERQEKILTENIMKEEGQNLESATIHARSVVREMMHQGMI